MPAGAKLGIMVELNCETDFVAKRPEFSELARFRILKPLVCVLEHIIGKHSFVRFQT